MNLTKNKTAAIAISLLLIISIGAAIATPTSSGHTPEWNITTHAYIATFPDPIGIGQTAYVDMWLDKVIAGSDLSNDWRFKDYKLTITAPDGTVTTKTFDYISDPTSNYVYSFTPDQTGTYTLNFTFPGQTYTYDTTSSYYNDYYQPSSATTNLTVTEEQLTNIQTSSLPTEYWSRPIYGTNTNWWTISSNWLGTGAAGYSTGMLGASFPGDAIGSQTAHIMWTKELQSGGLVGGDTYEIQGDTYFDGSAYNNRFNNPIIVDGMLIYREPLSFADGNNGDTVCIDLQTGKELWRRQTMPDLSFAMMYDVQDPNQHGVYPPLLIATIGGSFIFASAEVDWMVYDANSGTFLFNVTDVPSGTKAMGEDGEYLSLKIVNYGTTAEPNYYLQEWNASRLWTGQYSGSSTTPQVIPPYTNGTDAILLDFNVSLSELNDITGTATLKSAFINNMIIVESGTMPGGGNNMFSSNSQADYTYSAYSLESHDLGDQLWENTVSAPDGNLTISYSGADQTANDGEGVFTEYYTETMQFVGYSMATGEEIWGPTDSQTALAFFNTGYTGQGATIAYGRLYTGGYSGVIYCYDLDDGSLLWTYGNGGAGNSTSGGLETARPYPTIIYAIGNDIVYTFTSEHTVTTPIYKGALTRAINATTGEEIWTLSNDNNGGSTYGAMADGYNTIYNGYDEQIYCVGKGPTQTTMSVPHTGLDFDQSVVISGTVIDISSGTTQAEQTAKLPNGIACASDDSMSEWMTYVYQDQDLPSNFTGVEVTLNVIDQNGNYRTIGTTTTDASGTYRLTWTPDIAGDYTVIATFGGTNGYYGSYAEDGFTVMEQKATATPVPTTSPSMADLYFIPAIAGLFVAIVVVIALMLLILKKKP